MLRQARAPVEVLYKHAFLSRLAAEAESVAWLHAVLDGARKPGGLKQSPLTSPPKVLRAGCSVVSIFRLMRGLAVIAGGVLGVGSRRADAAGGRWQRAAAAGHRLQPRGACAPAFLK